MAKPKVLANLTNEVACSRCGWHVRKAGLADVVWMGAGTLHVLLRHPNLFLIETGQVPAVRVEQMKTEHGDQYPVIRDLALQ